MTAILKQSGPIDVGKHAYKGSSTHSTGTGQEVHGGKGGTTRKAPDWNALNRLHPERDGEIAAGLISDSDAAQQVTQMEMKAKVVEGIYERLKDSIDVYDWVELHANDMGTNDSYDILDRHYPPDEKIRIWISELVNDWASMHQDGINDINMAIGRVFDIPTSQELPGMVERGVEDGLPYDDMYRHAHEAFIEAMYEETQEYLVEMPEERMIFFRGLKGHYYSGDLNDSLDSWRIHIDDLNQYGKSDVGYGDWPGMIYTGALLKGRPGASWSASYSTAKEFAQGGVVLMVSVPREAVLSTARTGLGALSEDEVVLIDHGGNSVTVLSAGQTNASFEATLARTTQKLNEGRREMLAFYGLKSSRTDPISEAPFPRASNSRPEKIAWSEAVLERFYEDGVWVDTMEDPDSWSAQEIRDEYLS